MTKIFQSKECKKRSDEEEFQFSWQLVGRPVVSDDWDWWQMTNVARGGHIVTLPMTLWLVLLCCLTLSWLTLKVLVNIFTFLSIVAIWDIINFYSGQSVGTEEFWSVYWWVMFRLSCLVFLVFPEVFTRYKAGPEQILQTQQCMALFSSTVREAFKNAKFSGF